MSEEKALRFEVLSGAEGPCLVVYDGLGGTRIAGPKPWGGGRVIHTFTVDRHGVSDIEKAIAKLSAPTDGGQDDE